MPSPSGSGYPQRIALASLNPQVGRPGVSPAGQATAPSASPSPPAASSSNPGPAQTGNGAQPPAPRSCLLPASTVWKQCNLATTLLCTVLMVVLGFLMFKPQTLTTKLAVWESKKDFREYCNSFNQTGSTISRDCLKALKNGLPAPPVSRVKRRQALVIVANLDISGISIGNEILFSLVILLVCFGLFKFHGRNRWRLASDQDLHFQTGRRVLDLAQDTSTGTPSAWVPNFVARSTSSVIRRTKVGYGVMKDTAWTSMTEIDVILSNTRSRKQRRRIDDSVTKTATQDIQEESLTRYDSDDSHPGVWVPVVKLESSRFKEQGLADPEDDPVGKGTLEAARYITTCASLVEAASGKTFQFYIHRVPSGEREAIGDGYRYIIGGGSFFRLSKGDRHSSSLPLPHVERRIREILRDHREWSMTQPGRLSSWQLSLTSAYPGFGITSSTIGYDYTGLRTRSDSVPSHAVNLFLSRKILSIVFLVHPAEESVSVLIDCLDEGVWRSLIDQVGTPCPREDAISLIRHGPPSPMDESHHDYETEVSMRNDRRKHLHALTSRREEIMQEQARLGLLGLEIDLVDIEFLDTFEDIFAEQMEELTKIEAEISNQEEIAFSKSLLHPPATYFNASRRYTPSGILKESLPKTQDVPSLLEPGMKKPLAVWAEDTWEGSKLHRLPKSGVGLRDVDEQEFFDDRHDWRTDSPEPPLVSGNQEQSPETPSQEFVEAWDFADELLEDEIDSDLDPRDYYESQYKSNSITLPWQFPLEDKPNNVLRQRIRKWLPKLSGSNREKNIKYLGSPPELPPNTRIWQTEKMAISKSRPSHSGLFSSVTTGTPYSEYNSSSYLPVEYWNNTDREERHQSMRSRTMTGDG